jgi:hypothetical protein
MAQATAPILDSTDADMGITPRPSVSSFSVKTPIDGSRRGRAIVFWPLRR